MAGIGKSAKAAVAKGARRRANQCPFLCYCPSPLLRSSSTCPSPSGRRYQGIILRGALRHEQGHPAHNRDRSSAFLVANSSGDRMPFWCKSASRSILAKMSLSWAVAAREGSGCGTGAGARRGSGALLGSPFIETMGNCEMLTVPCWLAKVSEPPLPCC
jgi:hypothetical protein